MSITSKSKLRSFWENIRIASNLKPIFNALPGSVEGVELELLGVLIDNYEKQHIEKD